MEEVKKYEDCSVFVPTSSEEAVVLLAEECRGMGLFDTACSSDVCGKGWLQDYVASLTDGRRKEVKRNAWT